MNRNLIKIFREESGRTKKSLGQHFLTNNHIIDEIVSAADINDTDTIIEIGPGCGVLTEKLLLTSANLIAVEIDLSLTEFLTNQFSNLPNFSIINSDATQIEFATIAPTERSIIYIGNLPYNISVRIFSKICDDINRIKNAVFMFQKEVADRIIAKPKSKDYSSLSVFSSYYFSILKVRDLSGGNFMPNTLVQSTILKFTPHQIRQLDKHDEPLFFQLLKLSFKQKRKTLKNNLKDFIDIEFILSELKIKPSIRAEEVSLADFINIFNLSKNILKK